jgi:hypothetical protein
MSDRMMPVRSRLRQARPVIWIVVAVLAWCLLSLPLAVVVGRAIRAGDRRRSARTTVDVPARRGHLTAV